MPLPSEPFFLSNPQPSYGKDEDPNPVFEQWKDATGHVVGQRKKDLQGNDLASTLRRSRRLFGLCSGASDVDPEATRFYDGPDYDRWFEIKDDDLLQCLFLAAVAPADYPLGGSWVWVKVNATIKLSSLSNPSIAQEMTPDEFLMGEIASGMSGEMTGFDGPALGRGGGSPRPDWCHGGGSPRPSWCHGGGSPRPDWCHGGGSPRPWCQG